MFSYFARCPIHTVRIRVNNQEEDRNDCQRHQRELPFDVKHDDDHPNQGENIYEDADQPRNNKRLNGVNVGGDPAYQIPRLFLIVIRKREPLDMGIENATKVVGDPLPNLVVMYFSE